MFFRLSILAVFFAMSLGFAVPAQAQSINAKAMIDLINQNYEQDPTSKNHVSLKVDQALTIPYKIEFEISAQGLEITLTAKSEALKNPIMAREILARIYMTVIEEVSKIMPQVAATDVTMADALSKQKETLIAKLTSLREKYEIPKLFILDTSFEGTAVAADTYFNARLGSIIAQSQITNIEIEFEKNFRKRLPDAEYLAAMSLEERTKVIREYAALKGISLSEYTIQSLNSFASLQELELKKQKSNELAQKEQIRREKIYRDPVRAEARDKARLSTKLDDLIKNNDREGVAQLFEKMVPFELMEPTQITAWKSWIESIRRPSKDTITLFRGLDKYDRLIKNPLNNQAGLFAAMINRNQGSYSDRLRSLAKPLLVNRKTDLTNGISQQFYLHSIETPASPYISFSRDITIASMFAEKGMIAVQVDRRRAITNMFSILKAEAEILVPLIIFPDEIRAVQFGEGAHQNLESMAKTLGIPAARNFAELSENGRIYSDFYKFMTAIKAQTSQTKSCSKVFLK